MRKKMIALMTAGCMVFCGCGNTEAVSPGTTDIPIIIEKDDAPDVDQGNADHANTDDAGVNDSGTNIADSDGTGSDTSDTVEPALGSDTLPFTDFKNLTFDFASGAGGWATQLSIHSDGTFAGEYLDNDMGAYDESHPNGTAYQCIFNGQFSHPVKVNDYTYSMQILSISYVKEPDTNETKDGILYYYTTPYGLDGAETLLVYLPGAPLAELPEGYRSWVGYYYMENTTDTELPFYGLYNEAEAEGFSSYSEWESLKYNVEYIEEQAAIIEDALVNDGTLSQGDLNVKSGELYALWDSMLNIIWKSLRRVNDADTMRALTDEQLKWIAEKEQAVQEAGAEVEGGSLYPLITNTVAADMTKARVYELLALLEN